MNHVKREVIPFVALSVLVMLNAGLISAHGAQRADQSTAPEGASTSYRLDWATVGEVSGGDSASEGYRLSATVGQMGAGTRSISPNYTVCAGFQCAGGMGLYQVYLPLVLK
jgi:hypothetical protein